MTKTRRQSKAKAAQEAEEAESSQLGSSPVPRAPNSLVVSLPDDLDEEFLTGLLPDVSLDTPTPEAIITLYRLVIAQASEIDASEREVEEIKAEVERKDVELDQALQDKETATKELEVTLESVQNELKKVRQEKDEIAAARAELQVKLSSVSSSESASHVELETLKHRVEDTEREKRDLIGVVSRLKEDNAQRDEEIQSQRANLKQARSDYQVLESQLRDIRSTETSTKFKLESLTQQLQLAKSEAERTSADLTVKSEEFAKYRRAKHAELAQLQASHDQLSQTHSATESTLKNLQSSYTAQSHQLQQALARIQDLNGQLAEQESTYSSEAAGLRRLVQMMEEREVQTKGIVEGIEREYEQINDRAERREAVLREEIEAQMHRANEAEKKMKDLQKVLDRMDRGDFPMPSAPGTPARGTPATPARHGTPDFLTQGMMGLSPTVAMASRSQKGGKTFTEVYADYVNLQEEFAKKSMEYDHMDRTLSAVLAQIEERAPVLAQQRQEYERLQIEASQLASQLSQAIADRDAQASSAQNNAHNLTKSTRENELLEKQLNDLGRQVQTLLKELGHRQDPSIPPDEELEADTSLKPAENIEEVITNNLVLFRSIPALQEQNQKLLKIVRELGAKMEAEEREYKEELEKEQVEAIQEAHEAIKKLQEEIEATKRSSEITIHAYMKERDALKSTLVKERGMKRGVNGAVNGGAASDGSDSSEELVQVQNQFETYKMEMGVDSVRLREELLIAQRETGQLSSNLAKATAKNEYLNERHRMLIDQTNAQSRELDTLSKRNQELYDQYTRIDIECNRVSEDLLAAKSTTEQFRNECANLRAEKKIWESVQNRLVEENRTLAVERSQLSDLMSNVQRMHSDLERSNENDRKRLESQIQMLENSTQDLRTQLTQERDAVRHLTLQKDIELRELRTRLDKSSQDYSNTREALVAAETSQKHLTEQVEQFTRQLQGNEEKLAVYERRSSGANNIAQHQDQNLSREQQLEAEVAELRSALKVAEVDLASAKSHTEQFKEISQANETALSSLSATYEEYKSATEAQITMHQSDYAALQEKFKSVQQELVQVKEKHAELQRTLESERTAWANDKKMLEDTIVDISTSEKSSESDRTAREKEVRQQEERAKAAEERYSREVVAHAEAIKTVEDLRQQVNKAAAATRDNLALAETAQAKLATSETSWKQQKEALDKELADLNTRCKDLASQNSLLHQHLESVSSQAARIRQAADSSSVPTESGGDEDTDTKLSELRSVVTYLRKEKEIVDLQLELSKQENLRLKTQIEHLSQSLEESRKTLSEERERAVQAVASEAQHAELVERINQMALLRESNATLRADCEANAKRARAFDIKLQQLSTEVDPLKEQLRVTKAELESKNEQMTRLEEESRKWQERNTQLLTKYDRIDPAEVQALKDEIEKLKADAAEALKSATDREASLQQKLEHLRETGKKNNDIFKRRMEANKQTVQELESLKAQRATDASQNTQREQELNEQLEAVKKEKDALEKALADEKVRASTTPVTGATDSNAQSALVASLTQERDALLAEKATWVASTASGVTGDAAQWDSEKAILVKARDDALSQVKVVSEKASGSAEEIAKLRHQNSNFQSKIQDLMKARNADNERAGAAQRAAVNAAVEKLRAELQSSAPNVPEDVVNRHAQELRDLEQKLTQKHKEELKSALAAAAASAKVINANGTPEEAQKAIDAAIAAKEKEMKAVHDIEIQSAVDRGRNEVGMKLKLKDAQAVKAQNRLKAYEKGVQEWRAAGLITEEHIAKVLEASAQAAGVAVTAKPGPSTVMKPTASTTAKTAQPTNPVRPAQGATTQKPTPGAAAGPSNGLPQRPGAGHPAPTGPAQGAGVGRGRPVPRGAPRLLAAAGGLSIRGAAPFTVDPPLSGGVSIAGAANKRGREEGDIAGDDSLAKRLKPAEGTAPTAPAPQGRPVAIKRDRVSTPAPTPAPATAPAAGPS